MEKEENFKTYLLGPLWTKIYPLYAETFCSWEKIAWFTLLLSQRLKSKNVTFLFLLKWMKFILFTCFSVPMNLFSSVYYFLVNHLISDETLWPDVNKTRKKHRNKFQEITNFKNCAFSNWKRSSRDSKGSFHSCLFTIYGKIFALITSKPPPEVHEDASNTVQDWWPSWRTPKFP